MLFGVINAYVLLWPGDILYTYGLCGLLLFPFRKLTPTLLLVAALVCFLIVFGKGYWHGTEQQQSLVPGLMNGLARVGQMAFTNYLMQTIICTLIFYGYGLGYFGKLAFHQLYYVVAGVWVFQFIFSSVWLRYIRFGPLEWVWRSLTYWQQQPMRIGQSQ